MRLTGVLLAGALVGVACSGLPPKPGLADAGPPEGPEASTACVLACERLAMLACPEAETPDGGKPCVQLCEDAQSSGSFDMRPTCIAGATSVQAVRACGTVRCL